MKYRVHVRKKLGSGGEFQLPSGEQIVAIVPARSVGSQENHRGTHYETMTIIEETIDLLIITITAEDCE